MPSKQITAIVLVILFYCSIVMKKIIKKIAPQFVIKNLILLKNKFYFPWCKKQLVKKIVDSLPEDTSYDEILKELAFNKMIQKGLKDSKEGKVISNKEMKKRIQSW